MHLSVVCPTSNSYLRLDEGQEGNLHVVMEQARHNLAYHLSTHPLQILHISVLCTVCDGEIWVSVKFTRNLETLKHNERAFEWIGTISTKYQPLGEDSGSKSPSFLQHLPQLYQVGHTIDKRIISSVITSTASYNYEASCSTTQLFQTEFSNHCTMQLHYS